MSIWSPCVKVCFVDPEAGLCVGCFRSLEELSQWTCYTDEERAAIGESLPEREKVYKNGKARRPTPPAAG
ncbi:DUF1289 domain-containing protein [Hyphobacterium sp.]|uniref:DUF1289 domain-containing protein n=1 Tax=Hyphobacterium sp. TaxID=2004662 RepID=UPI003B52999F